MLGRELGRRTVVECEEGVWKHSYYLDYIFPLFLFYKRAVTLVMDGGIEL